MPNEYREKIEERINRDEVEEIKSLVLGKCEGKEGEEKLSCLWDALYKVTRAQDHIQISIGNLIRKIYEFPPEKLDKFIPSHMVFDDLNWIQLAIAKAEGDPTKYVPKAKYKLGELQTDWERAKKEAEKK